MKIFPSSFDLPRVVVFALVALALFTTSALAYDPMTVPVAGTGGAGAPLDLTVHDTKRDREIPVRVYLPTPLKDAPSSPVVIFSHGLGGNREGSAYLGEHWAARGYAVVYVQHPGSDDSVWKNVEPSERMAALKGAVTLKNFVLRFQDVPAVLDQLAIWNKESSHALNGRLDLARVGMSGHSFGAQTTQGLSGQSLPGDVGQRFADSRNRAAVAFSPNIPTTGDAKAAFAGVKIPWMLMTGTRDTSPINGTTTPETRQQVFTELPPGDKYEVVLNNAEHSAFTDRPLPGDTQPRNPNHHRVILALSTAFWDAYLKDNAEAKAWLAGDNPRGVMEKEDKWARK